VFLKYTFSKSVHSKKCWVG